MEGDEEKIKQRSDPLVWIKENSHIFLDQNMPKRVTKCMRDIGYKKVSDVFTMDYVGSNDGKLLRRIVEDKMILVTHDYKFWKMALKYNKKMAILIEGHTSLPQRLAGIIQTQLIHDNKLIRSYYGNKD